MKIRIDIDDALQEDEIIIRCRRFDDNIQKIHSFVSGVSTVQPKLSFFKDDVEYYLPLTDFLFFETENAEIHAHTANEVYRVKQRLYELEDILPNEFIRASKSTILNVSHVFSVTKNLTASSLVKFHKSHKQVYVSRMYFKTLRQRLDERRRNHET